MRVGRVAFWTVALLIVAVVSLLLIVFVVWLLIVNWYILGL
ncbi:MAG TPA: hypothetical protein VFH74_03675 [Gaiellales bacterium]|nr:hypothetical protein [Gaiellales bacterium]